MTLNKKHFINKQKVVGMCYSRDIQLIVNIQFSQVKKLYVVVYSLVKGTLEMQVV